MPSDFDAPGFYRCLSPGRQLSEHGHEVFMPDYDLTEDAGGRHRINFKFTLELPRRADLYVLQQRKERFWSEEGIAKMRSLGMATSSDVDDNYVNVPSYNPAFYGTHSYRRDDGVIINRKERRRIEKSTGYKPEPNKANAYHLHEQFLKVDLLTVSTPFLANVYDSYNQNIKVIRNYVDWDIWKDVQPQYEVERPGGRVRIGYLAVFKYRSADLKILEKVMPKFMKAHPEVDFVANSEETHNFLRIPSDRRITVGEYDFQPIENGKLSGDLPVGRMTAVCDIGLVPMAMNDLNQSKSHLKGMEYNAAGIPFIASPTESYHDYWLKLGYVGLRAATESDWYEQLEWLLADERLRRDMGRNGRMLAKRHSIQNNWREWENAYGELLGDKHYATARKSIQMGAVQKVSELGPLLQMVDEIKPQTIVEIGTARGGTFWALAQTAPDDATLVSMDIPSGSPIDVRNGKDVYAYRDRDRIKMYVKPNQKLRMIDMNSQTDSAERALVSAIDGKPIDVLFIDGDHRYEGVKNDFERYSKYVRPGGMIVFHDIIKHWDERVAVDVFWNEIKGEKGIELIGPETWGYSPWGGLGLIYKA